MSHPIFMPDKSYRRQVLNKILITCVYKYRKRGLFQLVLLSDWTPRTNIKQESRCLYFSFPYISPVAKTMTPSLAQETVEWINDWRNCKKTRGCLQRGDYEDKARLWDKRVGKGW